MIEMIDLAGRLHNILKKDVAYFLRLGWKVKVND